MLRILLVDDEVLVRTNIKLMLEQYTDQYIVCGEASDGQEALKLVGSVKPDVVISDMVMNPMNGLTLCEKLHSMLPSCHFIALSNYDDYQLVRGTLKNGATDYLLKHELSAGSLNSVLSKLQPSYDKQCDDIKSKESSTTVLREKFILDLLGAFPFSEDDLNYHISTLSIRLDLHQIYPIVMRIDSKSASDNKDDIRKQRLQVFSVTNICNEILSGYPTGVLTHTDNSFYCLLVSFESVHSEAEIQHSLNAIMTQLSANLKNYLNLEISFSTGKICSYLGSISESYVAARRFIEDSFAQSGTHTVNVSDEDPSEKIQNNQISNSFISGLRSALLSADQKKIGFLFHDLFFTINSQKLTIGNSQMIFFDLIHIAMNFCEERSIELNQIFYSSCSPFDVLTQMTSLDDIQECFITLYSKICIEISNQNLGHSPYVQKTISYITSHYHENLSLTEIAYSIGISSGYLSTLFKSETGIGFNDYLNQVRISAALKELQNGNIDFHMIASKSGFQDYSYFFHVFKKKTGKTPSEYINTLKC